MISWQQVRSENPSTMDIILDLGIIYPPIDPFNIAIRLGIKTFYGDFTDNGSGSLLYENGNPYIVINRNDPYHKQQFTVAYLLGNLFTGIPGKQYDYGNCKEDKLANIFAIDLLMPIDMITLYLDKPIDMLAKMFDVSEEAIYLRVKSLTS